MAISDKEAGLLKTYLQDEMRLAEIANEKARAVALFTEKAGQIRKRRRATLRELQRLYANTIPDSE